jgi:hypothetical protein
VGEPAAPSRAAGRPRAHRHRTTRQAHVTQAPRPPLSGRIRRAHTRKTPRRAGRAHGAGGCSARHLRAARSSRGHEHTSAPPPNGAGGERQGLRPIDAASPRLAARAATSTPRTRACSATHARTPPPRQPTAVPRAAARTHPATHDTLCARAPGQRTGRHGRAVLTVTTQPIGSIAFTARERAPGAGIGRVLEARRRFAWSIAVVAGFRTHLIP